jgi:hypothetical protein
VAHNGWDNRRLCQGNLYERVNGGGRSIKEIAALPDIEGPTAFLWLQRGASATVLNFCSHSILQVVSERSKYRSTGNDYSIFKSSGLEQTIVTGGGLIDFEKAAVCKSTSQTFIIKIFKVQPRLMHLPASSPCIRRVTRRYKTPPGYMMSNEPTRGDPKVVFPNCARQVNRLCPEVTVGARNTRLDNV